MVTPREIIQEAQSVIYRSKLKDETRITLRSLVINDLESFVIGAYEAYHNKKCESKYFSEFLELSENAKNNEYFKGLADAVEGKVVNGLSDKNYVAGWNIGKLSNMTLK